MLAFDPGRALSNEGLGEAWIAEEAVASALWCWWRAPDDFQSCVTLAANTDGDSDTIGCIAGGIAGAYVGAEGIPPRWASEIENGAALRELAARLHAVTVRAG
jgi:ADP-ribosylglycohydrolase